MFISCDSQQITQIPIGQHDKEDNIIWVSNKDEKYSMQYGYHFFQSLEIKDNPCPSNYNKA